MVYRIEVEPFGDGWAVRPQMIDNLLVFLRGAAAEACAKALAEKISATGQDALIEFRLRDGEVIRRFICPAASAAPAAPAKKAPAELDTFSQAA